MTHYFRASLDELARRADRFHYTSVAMHGKMIAFGGPTGSIHLFEYEKSTPPIVISLASISTSIYHMSFSPNGSWLLVCDQESVSLVENPLTSPSLAYKIDIKGNKVTESLWICDPPRIFLDRTTQFLYLGDSTGHIWGVHHQAPEFLGSVNSSIFQFSLADSSLLINAQNGAYFLKDGKISSKVGKRPVGDFGGIYAEEFNAICFSRPDGKLVLAGTNGKAKAILPLLENGKPNDIPENLGINLSYLLLCGKLLVSAGKDNIVFIVNLSNGKLVEYISEKSPFIGMTKSGNTLLLYFQNRLEYFRICENDEEYLDTLISRNQYEEAQKFAVETNIEDLDKLQSLLKPNQEDPNYENTPIGKQFLEQIYKIKLMEEPQQLSFVDPILLEQISGNEIPSPRAMKKLYEILDSIIVDDDLKSTINRFVLANPQYWDMWADYLDFDTLIEKLNEDDSTVPFALEMAPRGNSDLAQMLANIDDLSVEYLAANSPPVKLAAITADRRSAYEKLLKPLESDDDELIESPYNAALLKLDEVTPENAIPLLRLRQWEMELEDAVDSLAEATDAFFMGRSASELPPWLEQGLSGELPRGKDGCGHWGAKADSRECAACGMPVALEEAACSAQVFPCGHTFHVPCVRTRFCPLCYATCIH